MITLVKNDDIKLKIVSDILPEPYARAISPLDSPEIIEEKNNFPFKLKIGCNIEIAYIWNIFNLEFKDGFTWNGASIPRWIWPLFGSNADPKFLIPSMIHDLLCNKKDLINYDRKLSSLIFKELLISCGTGRFKANLMTFAVDNFQKLPFNGW